MSINRGTTPQHEHRKRVLVVLAGLLRDLREF